MEERGGAPSPTMTSFLRSWGIRANRDQWRALRGARTGNARGSGRTWGASRRVLRGRGGEQVGGEGKGRNGPGFSKGSGVKRRGGGEKETAGQRPNTRTASLALLMSAAPLASWPITASHCWAARLPADVMPWPLPATRLRPGARHRHRRRRPRGRVRCLCRRPPPLFSPSGLKVNIGDLTVLCFPAPLAYGRASASTALPSYYHIAPSHALPIIL